MTSEAHPALTAMEQIGTRRAEAAPAHQARRCHLKMIAGAGAVLARVTELGHESPAPRATPFQSASWLAAVVRSIAREENAEILAIEATPHPGGHLAMVVPLAVRREGALRVARILDFGVSDYRAPILGRAASCLDGGCRAALWRELRRALRGHADLVHFEAMPAVVGGASNPLAQIPEAARSRLSGFRLTVETSVEQLLRDRGKKYRKEAERCFRLLAKEGEPRFRQATTPEAIERAYAALEAQQSQRHEMTGTDGYVLDQPRYSDFYRDLLLTERETGFARIFTLEAGGVVVAVLMGIVRGDTFTLLRISNGGTAWRHLSPGRLVVIEAMRHLVAAGVRSFDMGAGDYPFKRGFGVEEIPLYDLVAAVSAKGLPALAKERTKSWLRRHPTLVDKLKRLRGRRS